MNILRHFLNFKKALTNNLFVKFFMAFIVISVSLTIMISFYTNFYILGNLDSEIEKFEIEKINETINTMNVLFGEMRKLSVNHAMNSDTIHFAYFPRDYMPQKQQEVKSIQELLSSSINSSNYIRSISIYYKKNDYILDYSGAMDLSSYYDKDWYDAFNNMNSSFEILNTRKVKDRNNPSSNSFNNIITLLTKIPYDSSGKEGAVILNLDENIISDLLKNITYSDSKTIACLVNNNGIILSSNKNEYIYKNIIDIIDIPDDYTNSESGSFKLKINGLKMISYYKTTKVNNWKLFYIASESKIYEKSTYIRNLNIIIFTLLLLIIIFVSLFFSSRLYNPIKKIIFNIKKSAKADDVNDENLSDVSIIQNSLRTLLENNQALESQLTDNRTFMREIFLNQLISGILFNRNEIMKRAAFLELNLNYDYFKVTVFKYNSSAFNSISMEELELQKISITNTIEAVFNDLNIPVNCSQDSEDNILVLLKLYSTDDINEIDAMIEQTLEDLKMNIENFLGISVSIGIGRRYNDLANIGVSYKEALEALSYRFLKDDNPIISYSDISRSEVEKLVYPIEMEQKLIELIKLNNYDESIIVLNDMIGYIMERNKNFQHIEICLTNIAGIIERCLFELNLNIYEVFGKSYSFTFSMDNFKNIQQFTEWISSKFRLITDYRINQAKDSAGGFANEIKEYIDKCYSQELSLLAVAEHFRYSSSYFCKIFKEKIGTSFWEYVSTVRIEKSKALLVETDNSIEHIAEKVGYNNRFSYIRTFKKYNSITPSEYRIAKRGY